jgi:hypothetical protein
MSFKYLFNENTGNWITNSMKYRILGPVLIINTVLYTAIKSNSN